MILNKINYKDLALYGILKINNNYTIDSDKLRVNATVSISYNLSNIEDTILQIQQQVEELANDAEQTTEIRDHLNQDYNERLEILNLIKEKLS